MIITKVRHAWPNPAGFCLNRAHGHVDYSFVHFTSGVKMRENGVEIDIPAHACIVWRPKTPQFFYCYDEMIHDWFHFKDIPESLFEELDIPLDTLFYPKQWSFITDLVAEIENEFFAGREHGEALMELKVRELLVKLSRSVNDRSTDTEDREIYDRFLRFRREMLQTPAHGWSIAEMAERTSFSQSRFFYLYKSFFGRSPMDDLICARIDFAKSMLSFSDEGVEHISESLGYANVTHFCRQFRKLTGMTPTQYRKIKR